MECHWFDVIESDKSHILAFENPKKKKNEIKMNMHTL